MKDILQYIDSQIDLCAENVKFIGLCHLLEDDSEDRYPATVELDAIKASPDDNFDITIYHRLLDGDFAPREEEPFGRRRQMQNTQRVRTVVFIKIEVDDHVNQIDDIINILPDSIELEGYAQIFLSKEISLIRDSAAIWEDEFSEAYKDKYQAVYHVFALEYDVTYVKCPVCVS